MTEAELKASKIQTRWNEVNFADDVGSIQMDILLSLLLSMVLLALRYGIQKFCLIPLGNMLEIKNRRSKTVQDIPLLERAYLNKKRYTHVEIQGWAKQLDWSARQVERWLRLRSQQNKPTQLDKFCESCWRFLYYLFAFSFGLYILWNKPWLRNIKECWKNYPNHSKPLSIWLYYMLSLANYWSLSISQFFDAKRKDFWQMFIHHIVTIFLLMVSWIARFHRIGTLILLTHDVADIPLEAAKLTNYAGWKICNVLFGVFAITWIASRTVLFPFWILKSTLMDTSDVQFPQSAYYVFNGALILLMVLHIYWTNLLVKFVSKALATGNMEKDIRSSESNCSD